jgi:hypothetical protein
MDYNWEGKTYSEPHCEPEVYKEPRNKSEARLIAERSAEIINAALDFITASESPSVAAWAVSLALGSANNEGIGCSDRAARLNVTPAALSKQMRQFIEDNDLNVSGYTYEK